MRIEHVAMYVEDLEKTKEFFIKYFDAAAGEQYYNPKTEFQSYFLSFEDGARLEIMQKPRVSNVRKELARTGYIHLAFSVGSSFLDVPLYVTDRLSATCHLYSTPSSSRFFAYNFSSKTNCVALRRKATM